MHVIYMHIKYNIYIHTYLYIYIYIMSFTMLLLFCHLIYDVFYFFIYEKRFHNFKIKSKQNHISSKDKILQKNIIHVYKKNYFQRKINAQV